MTEEILIRFCDHALDAALAGPRIAPAWLAGGRRDGGVPIRRSGVRSGGEGTGRDTAQVGGGKRASGRLLDGRMWDEYPEVD